MVADTDELCKEVFPAASVARILYLYVVAVVSPVSEYELDEGALI